jgi:hypothetical protein
LSEKEQHIPPETRWDGYRHMIKDFLEIEKGTQQYNIESEKNGRHFKTRLKKCQGFL